MAVLYVTEYEKLARDERRAVISAGLEPAVAEQTVAIGGTSTQSAAFAGETRFVSLHTDVACHVKFGASPTATTSTRRMPADSTIFLGVRPGEKVAVIQTS